MQDQYFITLNITNILNYRPTLNVTSALTPFCMGKLLSVLHAHPKLCIICILQEQPTFCT